MAERSSTKSSSFFRIWAYFTGTIAVVASVLTLVIYVSGKPYLSDWLPPRAEAPSAAEDRVSAPAVDPAEGRDERARPGWRATDNPVKNFVKGIVVVFAAYVGVLCTPLTALVDLFASLFTPHAMPLTRGMWHYIWGVMAVEWFWNAGHPIISTISVIFWSVSMLLPMAAAIAEDERRTRNLRKRRVSRSSRI